MHDNSSSVRDVAWRWPSWARNFILEDRGRAAEAFLLAADYRSIRKQIVD